MQHSFPRRTLTIWHEDLILSPYCHRKLVTTWCVHTSFTFYVNTHSNSTNCELAISDANIVLYRTPAIYARCRGSRVIFSKKWVSSNFEKTKLERWKNYKGWIGCGGRGLVGDNCPDNESSGSDTP